MIPGMEGNGDCESPLRRVKVWLVGAVIVVALALGVIGVGRPAVARGLLAEPGAAAPLDLERLDAFVREEVERHAIPGLALGVVEGDEVVLLRGYGRADESGRPVTAQTPFLLASVSKPLTAMAVMQLVEAGKVELDAPLQRYVPEFRMADEAASAITVRHLLLHTSGLPATSCDTRVDATTLAGYVAELQSVRLSGPVGARHNYCSGNYNLLGRIVEKVSGQSFGEYVQEQVFAPLEMEHSFVHEQAAVDDGMAEGHQWLFGVRVPMHHRYNPSQLPSGYLISSAEDMSHFLVAQLNEGRYGAQQLLAPGTIAEMQSPGVSVGEGQGAYGLGWRIATLGGVPATFHYGDNFDYHTLIMMDVERKRGAVLLVNGNNLLAVMTAFKGIEEGVMRLLVGEEPLPPSSWALSKIYWMVDIPLALILLLVLWPLMRMGGWLHQQQQRQREGTLRLGRIRLRAVFEIALPVLLLVSARWLLHQMGAQSWGEALNLMADVIVWLWAVSLLMALTGVVRLTLARRFLSPRRGGEAHGTLDPTNMFYCRAVSGNGF